MTRYCLCLVLLIQGSFIFANCDEPAEDCDTREILNQKPDFDDNVVKDFQNAKKDWIDIMFLESGPGGLYPASSAAMMAATTSSDKSPEQQIEDMKSIVREITEIIESEMINLLSDAIAHCDKSDQHTKHKRSVPSPMDSSQMVMRLLKHIKANNDYQNIAIEKMMTAQQIADKYGIKYDPDEDLLDLASFTNKQSEELSSILNDMTPKKEEVEFVPLNANEDQEKAAENSTYYVYGMHVPEEIQAHFNSYPPYEYMPEQIRYMPEARPAQQHFGPHPHHNHYNFPETQIPAPPVHCSPQPVCQRPTIYEPAFTPAQQYYHPCGPMEPITTTTTIMLPFEEPVAPEPELVGQVFEETVSNKVYIEQGEEPGSTDVNHVMTYTVSEKSHFKTPEIEKLPQQMQYYFFLN